MDLDGDPHELADGVQLTVFRVAQEALTNTLKHAAPAHPRASGAELPPGAVELEVTDTGRDRRPCALAGGRGLHGMRERAATYGGKLEAGPRPQGGWRVHLRLRPRRREAP